jgi:hypothetical protein
VHEAASSGDIVMNSPGGGQSRATEIMMKAGERKYDGATILLNNTP